MSSSAVRSPMIQAWLFGESCAGRGTAEFPEMLLPCKLFVEAQSTNKAWPSIGISVSLDCRDESCRTTPTNSQKRISTNEPRDPRGPHGFQKQIKMFYIRLAGEIRHWITALIISSM